MMRTICGLLLFLASAAAAFDLMSLHHDLTRLKRESVEDGSLCLMTCIEAMEEQLDTIKGAHTQHTRLQQSTSACQRYDPDQLDALCGSHSGAKRCIDACPEGEMRTVGINALAPLNFMCLDRLRDFKQHLPCLDAICDRVESACQPNCRQYKGSVDKLTDIQRDQNVRQAYDTSAVIKIVSHACEYIECFNECSRPLITDKCGHGAADLQRDTVRRAFSSITNLLSGTRDSEDALPNSCQSLLTPVHEGFGSAENATWSYAVPLGKTTMKTKVNGTAVYVKSVTTSTGPRQGPSDAEIEETNLLLEEADMLSSGGTTGTKVKSFCGIVGLFCALGRFLTV